MTTYEKAKAYEYVSQKVKDFFEGKQKMYSDVKQTLEYLFPELAESEDERIRKYLIDFVEQYGDNYYGQVAKASAITWLEKQGEPQTYKGNADTMRKNLIKAFKSVGSNHWGGFDVRDIIHWLESKDAIELEKPDEKTYPILSNSSNIGKNEQNLAGTIEPKFKIGDWVVYEAEAWREVLQIETIDEHYTFTNGSSSSFDEEQYMRLWTIQDAKDGDVLADDDSITIFRKIGNDIWYDVIDFYVCYNYRSDKIIIQKDILHCGTIKSKIIKPATKEQRELLFSKMKEAGYEWDAEKKELRKIEQNTNDLPKGEDYGIDGLWHAKTILEKTLGKVEGYQSDDGILEHKCAINVVKNLYERKPAWSDEDDETITRIVFSFEEEMFPSKQECRKNIDFLNSLKNRVQQKQEWGKDDEDAIGMAIKALEDLCDVDCPADSFVGHHLSFAEAVERLKVLKPRPHWKPTEKQLNALLDCMNNSTKQNFLELNPLYEELVKL